MINPEILIAKKYAQAFINIFSQELDPQTIAKLEELVSFLDARQRVLFYMHLAFIPEATIKKTLYTILYNYHLDKPVTSLIDILITHKRIYLFPSVISNIISLYKENNNILDFTIASSHELSEMQLEELRMFLERKTGKTIYYKTLLDKRLIAGIKMYSDTLYWEHSIRKQLNALSTLKN